MPDQVERLGTQSTRILWGDGHISEYPNLYLREHCPCAMCRERPSGRHLPVVERQGTGALYPTRIGVVGRYALSFEWSDRHDTGIYSYETLRALCPCASCHTTSGPST